MCIRDRANARYSSEGGQTDGLGKMFFSASPNVARRYGKHVFITYLPASNMPRISVDDWFNAPPDALPKESFVIEGDEGFDFPVDTLVLRKPVGIWIKTDTESLYDDGLALTHEPKQNERQFDLYISEHYDGDIELWRVETSE